MVQDTEFFFAFFTAFQHSTLTNSASSTFQEIVIDLYQVVQQKIFFMSFNFFFLSHSQNQKTDDLKDSILQPLVKSLITPTSQNKFNKSVSLAIYQIFKYFPFSFEIILKEIQSYQDKLPFETYALSIFSVLKEAKKTKALENLNLIIEDSMLQTNSARTLTFVF